MAANVNIILKNAWFYHTVSAYLMRIRIQEAKFMRIHSNPEHIEPTAPI